IFRVGQPTGRGDHPLFWDGNINIIIAKSVIELGIALEWIGSPSVYIIIYTHFRIPIANIKEVIFVVAHPDSGSALRNFKIPVDGNFNRFTGSNTLRWTHNHQCTILIITLGGP